jgi:arylsulfate sulfotransferase
MRVLAFALEAILCVSASGKMTLTLTSSPFGPQRVGTPVTWTAAVSGTQPGIVEFEFRGHRSAAPARLLRGFHSSNQIVWAAPGAEGSYAIHVTARNKSTGETAEDEAAFIVTSNVTGGAPVIMPTANPLVALYSAPGCPAGSSMYVKFGMGGTFSSTNPMPCSPASSMNFYVGGMLPATTYDMYYVIVTGGTEMAGSVQQFTTGTIDPSLAFPYLDRLLLPGAQSSVAQPVLLFDYLSPPGGPYYFPTAVDLEGRTIWYYPALGVPAQNTTYFIRPIANSQGHILLIANDPTSTPSNGQILREIDLAGNTVAEVHASQVTEQLEAQGKLGVIGFNHDAIRLPNGHTLAICSQERIYPAGTQGSAAPVDLVGNAIVDFDENWNVAWSWSAYDHLDVNRAAILGETCYDQPGCPTLTLATEANDWLHANSLNYLPDAGDILLSIRHQDWVIRIDYANGAGTGDVKWKLGLGGDFTIQSSDPYPWFSHQHDAQLNTATGVVSVFDNGNTRVALAGGGDSRGYVLQINEANFTAVPILLNDLGVYSSAVGSAQLLDNGNWHFHAGLITSPMLQANTFEILPDGSHNYLLQEILQVYRSYRMSSLYSQQ